MTAAILQERAIRTGLQSNSPGLQLRNWTESDTVAWDNFVKKHPLGSPFHLSAWKRSIENTFSYRPMYVMAVENQRVRGVLPLFLVNNPLMGRVLLSTPFAVYGGVLADSDASREILLNHASALGHELNVQHVELRNAYPEQCAGFSRVSRYVTFTQNVGPDEKQTLEAIPRKTRYMVRKALKEQLETRVQTSDYSTFEEMYSRNLRRLGTPSFPPRFFGALLENFRGSIDIRETVYQGKVVAAVLSLYFRDQALPYYGASDPAYNELAPNNFMYYDLMRWAGLNGFRTFDFGRSKTIGSTSYEFKARWGMQERPLPYEMLLVKRKTLPHYSPSNPAFRLPIEIWRRLPLAVTRKLGPTLVRLVP